MERVEKSAVRDSSIGNRRIGKALSTLLDKTAVLPLLVILWIVFSLLSPTFFTVRNFQTLFSATTVVAVAAIGEAVVLISGALDLSVASVAACAAVVSTAATGQDGSWLIALLICVGIGLAFGTFNGIMTAGIGVVPFVLTLGTDLVARGIAFTVSRGYSLSAPKAIGNLGFAMIAMVPAIALIAVVLLVVSALFLGRTVWGRYIYLVGSNIEAARYVGISTKMIRGSAFVLSGLMGGIAGFLSVANLGVGLPGVGDPILLTIIGGVILGGTSLFGGKGSIGKMLTGVLLLATLSNGLNLLGITFYDLLVAQGAVILLGTALTVNSARRA